MLGAFKLLLAIAVLCCGLHLGEPAEAGTAVVAQFSAIKSSPSGTEAAIELRHGIHHHCAIDADHHADTIDLATPASAPLFLTAVDERSVSHGRPPPIRPPSG